MEIQRVPLKRVAGVKDVQAHAFTVELAKYLKMSGKITLPKYVDYAKTGVAKELAPYDPDWFYIRCASLARRVYVTPGTGVGAFRHAYSTRMRRKGVVPEHTSIAAGGIIRNCLQQLEGMGLVEKDPNGGRRISSSGRQALDRIATIAAKNQRKALGGIE